MFVSERFSIYGRYTLGNRHYLYSYHSISNRSVFFGKVVTIIRSCHPRAYPDYRHRIFGSFIQYPLLSCNAHYLYRYSHRYCLSNYSFHSLRKARIEKIDITFVTTQEGARTEGKQDSQPQCLQAKEEEHDLARA